MKRLLRLTLAVMFFSSNASGQCGAGYTQAQLNWDALEFLNTSNYYATFVTSAMAATQSVSFATQKATITHNFTGTNNQGISTAHTGETSSNGTGADILLLGNGAITFTFATAVQNVTFSLYDVDVSQRATFTASNGATPVSIALTTVTGTGLTITNNNTTSARVDASSTAAATTSTSATVNVSITGPITSFTITITNTGTVTNGPAAGREDGSFYISDVTACTNVAAYPTSYYAISQPWTGQPGYVLIVVNNSIYQLDPATGKAKLIFTDASSSNINSLAYDPYNHYIYYTYSLTSSPATDKTVKKYDYNTGTISTFISDVTTLGIPVYESGVESGAAAFYNGCLYLGVEGYGGTSTSFGRRSVMWKIIIDATSGAATSATQAYAVASDNGTTTTNTHDWSDVGINNGILYDFDGSAGNEDVYQFNMYTGALTRYTPVSTFTPNQVSVDWQGNMYNVNAAIAKYNGTTGLTTGTTFTITATGLPSGGSYGDAAEAFKPKGDLGDAPASYDPVALSPAIHEVSSTLRLGASITSEWTKNTSTLATGDADDGLPTPSIVINNSNYLTSVNVFNNTGAAATVCAWVDFNNNGVFDASEGVTVSVPTSSSTQTVQLFWPNPTTTLTPYSYTFIRIRVTSASNGMTTSNPTGYYNDGEVEDYRVQVNAYTLPTNLLSFEARKQPGRKGLLIWDISDELPGSEYHLQRSADGRQWQEIFHTRSVSPAQRRGYQFVDARPLDRIGYYRVQIIRPGGQSVYSNMRELYFGNEFEVNISPNPATTSTQLWLSSPIAGTGTLRLYTDQGALIYQELLNVPAGSSERQIPLPGMLAGGTYLVEIQFGADRKIQRLVLRR
jgi:hypothetical protein